MSKGLPVGPTTYSAWAALLDRFAAGEESVLEQMQTGKLEWTAVVAERFTQRVVEAFNVRLKRIVTSLQREFDYSRGNTHSIAQGLVRARTQLGPLQALAKLGVLPPHVQKHLTGELERLVKNTQSLLEQSAVGTKGLIDVLRLHPLRVPLTTALESEKIPNRPSYRRVIL